MQNPATIPRPISSCVRPFTTWNPSAPPPISPAMMTTESTIMIVWFTPSRIEGRASGSCTFSSSCRGVAPYATAASTDLLRHLPDPEVREPDRRRQRVDRPPR